VAALGLALLASLAAALGGMLPVYTRVREIGTRYLLGFAAGVMVSVGLVVMLPQMAKQEGASFIALAIGFFALYATEKMVTIHSCREGECEVHGARWTTLIGIATESLLDGIAIAHSCIHVRQAFSSWRLHVPVEYDYYMFMPAKPQSPAAQVLLTREVQAFKESLEGWTGRAITRGSLEEAIEAVNTGRRLMRQVYELRKAERPPLTGAEAMEMAVSGQMMDRREHNALLQQALVELPGRVLPKETGLRLMIVGSEDDDTEMLRLIESLGATIVIDDHCTGSRHFWNLVELKGDPLASIAARYVQRPPCPQKDWEGRRRLEHIRRLAAEYRVQGAIVIQQKFCDPHELDNPVIISLLEQELDIPSLFLEFDVTIPVGQFQTRIEAFLEMLRLEV